jgi:hypothetical protein
MQGFELTLAGIVIKRIKSPYRNIRSHRENENLPQEQSHNDYQQAMETHVNVLEWCASEHPLNRSWLLQSRVEVVEKVIKRGASWHVGTIQFH